MEFGHGFIARVDERNHKGVDRGLGPPGQSTLLGDPPELPWVIADGAWALTQPPLVEHLREAGTKMVFDTHAWRFREAATFAMPKFRDMPSAPGGPLDLGDRRALGRFVARDLELQARLGGDAYLVPGFVPRDGADQVLDATLQAIEFALDQSALPGKPMVAFVGIHASNLDAAPRFLERLHHGLEAVYVQFSPVDPVRDGTSKIVKLTEVLRIFEAEEFTVIAGRLAGAGHVVKAAGVSAADAGLGEGETFRLGDKVRLPLPRQQRAGKGGRGPRLYVAQIGRSVDAQLWNKLLEIDDLRGRLRCAEACCRFKGIDSTVERATEHSLRWRVKEAQRLTSLEVPLRPALAGDLLEQQRALLSSCNAALREMGGAQIRSEHVEHQIAALGRLWPPKAA